MGTLIPQSPALGALASGDITELTAKLRVAFSVTVLRLLVGIVAFGISLVRDRIHAQDLSDVEYIGCQTQSPVRGGGNSVGKGYQLANGRLVYMTKQ